jgi:hypothetical protein
MRHAEIFLNEINAPIRTFIDSHIKAQLERRINELTNANSNKATESFECDEPSESKPLVSEPEVKGELEMLNAMAKGEWLDDGPLVFENLNDEPANEVKSPNPETSTVQYVTTNKFNQSSELKSIVLPLMRCDPINSEEL